jgi:hypothetical protein
VDHRGGVENDPIHGKKQLVHHQKKSPVGIDTELLLKAAGNEKPTDTVTVSRDDAPEAVPVTAGKLFDTVGITVMNLLGSENHLYDPIRLIHGGARRQKGAEIFGQLNGSGGEDAQTYPRKAKIIGI